MEEAAYFTLSFDELMMVALTVIIAGSVVGQAIFASRQARYAREQADLFAESEKRQRERERPRIRITPAGYGVDDKRNESAGARRKEFVGVMLANASPFDITITRVEFEVGVPVDLPFDRSRIPAPSLQFSAVGEYGDTRLSDALPKRLRHGETMRVLYDEDKLLEKLERHGGGDVPAVLPVCHDSLGNRHAADIWTVWGKNYLGGSDGPGPGRVAWHDWWARHRPP